MKRTGMTSKVKSRIGEIKSACRSVKMASIVELLIVIAIFTILTIILTGGVLFNMNSQLYTGGIGDATSGFLWFAFADKGLGYLDGTTQLINYPVGEALWSPIYITWTFAMWPLWLLSRVLSPIAALNIVMLFGFVSCGVAVYYLLKRVTKQRYLAFIGAYAVAFVPYHFFKAPEHLTNILVWPFVGFIGFLIAFWRRQTPLRGAGLAIVSAIACYTDGYFVFILFVLGLSLMISLLFVDRINGASLRQIGHKLLKLTAVVAAIAVLVVPIIFTQLTAGKEINQDLSNTRDDIKLEVQYYASKPIDFLLPPEKNITVSSFDWFNKLNAQKNARSNSGENTNYVGVVVGVLYVAGLIVIVARGLRYIKVRRVHEHNRTRQLSLYDYVWVVSLISVPFALVWMLPPTIHILGVTVTTPVGILIDHISFWRVPARVFLVLHIFLVFAAILTLGYFIRRLGKRWYFIILLVVLVAIAIDYYTGIKRPAFGVENMPKTYSWIRDQTDIKSIAELPLVDWPVEISGYYMFAQLIHEKPIVNSGLARTGYGLFNPLSSVDNEETIRFLRQRGVDTLVLHAPTCRQYSWGVLRYQEHQVLAPAYIDKNATSLCVYHLNSQPGEDTLFVRMHDGFSKSNYLSDKGVYWVVMDGGRSSIDVVDALGHVVDAQRVELAFKLSVVGDFKKKPLGWKISQHGKEVGRGEGYDEGVTQKVENLDSREPIVLDVYDLANNKPVSKNEVGLGDVVITRQ